MNLWDLSLYFVGVKTPPVPRSAHLFFSGIENFSKYKTENSKGTSRFPHTLARSIIIKGRFSPEANR